MTSNLGAAYLNELPDSDGPIPEATKELVQGAIRGHFPPEFINRIDSIITYSPLSRKNVRQIVEVRVAEVQKRLKANGKDIKLEVTTEALDWLGATGYHPSYGARPLNRAIQTELLNPLSRLLIADCIRDGEVAKGTLCFRSSLPLSFSNTDLLLFLTRSRPRCQSQPTRRSRQPRPD